MKPGAFLLAFVIASCAPAPPRLSIAEGFSADERADIARAVAKWNTVLSSPLVIEEGAPWTIRHETPPHFDGAGHFVGETVVRSHTVYISPTSAHFYPLVLHELGHVAGLPHVDVGVMAPVVGATEFSPADLRMCALVGACEVSSCCSREGSITRGGS